MLNRELTEALIEELTVDFAPRRKAPVERMTNRPRLKASEWQSRVSSDATKPFTPALSPTESRKLRGRIDNLPYTPHLLFIFPFMLPFSAGLATLTENLTIGMWIAGPTVFGVLATIGGIELARFKRSRAYRFYTNENFKALKTWAKNRYGVTLSSLDSQYSSDHSMGYETKLCVEDSPIYSEYSNRYLQPYLVLRPSQDGTYDLYSGKTFKLPKRIDAAKPQPLLSSLWGKEAKKEDLEVEDSPFDGKSAAIYSKVQKKISTLSSHQLSIEGDHVVTRAKNDLEDLIEVNNNLARFAAKKNKQINLEILTTLDLELQKVLDDEVKNLNQNLSVQHTYIRSRNESTSRLNLN